MTRWVRVQLWVWFSLMYVLEMNLWNFIWSLWSLWSFWSLCRRFFLQRLETDKVQVSLSAVRYGCRWKVRLKNIYLVPKENDLKDLNMFWLLNQFRPSFGGPWSRTMWWSWSLDWVWEHVTVQKTDCGRRSKVCVGLSRRRHIYDYKNMTRPLRFTRLVVENLIFSSSASIFQLPNWFISGPEVGNTLCVFVFVWGTADWEAFAAVWMNSNVSSG